MVLQVATPRQLMLLQIRPDALTLSGETVLYGQTYFNTDSNY